MDEVTILVRTLLPVILGGVIGLERQSKHRPAGFRTHILVCLGSSTIMMLSELMLYRYQAEFGMAFDPTRMAAQVVSGIGFLGAGTIIHYRSNVKGLTTAASLWAVAAIGLAVGAGFIGLAITVSVVLYVTLLLFNRISLRMDKQGNVLEILVTLYNEPKTIGKINLMLAKNNAKILDMKFINRETYQEEANEPDEVISIRVICRLPDGASNVELMNSFRLISGVLDVERL